MSLVATIAKQRYDGIGCEPEMAKSSEESAQTMIANLNEKTGKTSR